MLTELQKAYKRQNIKYPMLSNLELLDISEKNLSWFNDNFENISEKHAGRIVAIKNKEIVASAKNINELLDILKKQNIDESEVLIEPVFQKNEIVIL